MKSIKNKVLEETASALGKKIQFVEEKSAEFKAFSNEQVDTELINASITDAINSVNSTEIKSALKRLLNEGTIEEKVELLTSTEDTFTLGNADELKVNYRGAVCEFVCFTVCTTTGSIGGPGGPDDLADKCYEKCKKVCV